MLNVNLRSKLKGPFRPVSSITAFVPTFAPSMLRKLEANAAMVMLRHWYSINIPAPILIGVGVEDPFIVVLKTNMGPSPGVPPEEDTGLHPAGSVPSASLSSG